MSVLHPTSCVPVAVWSSHHEQYFRLGHLLCSSGLQRSHLAVLCWSVPLLVAHTCTHALFIVRIHDVCTPLMVHTCIFYWRSMAIGMEWGQGGTMASSKFEHINTYSAGSDISLKTNGRNFYWKTTKWCWCFTCSDDGCSIAAETSASFCCLSIKVSTVGFTRKYHYHELWPWRITLREYL